MQFGEDSFIDHVLYCDPKKRPKHMDPNPKCYPLQYTDSLIAALMKKYGISGYDARTVVVNSIKNAKRLKNKSQQ